LSARGLLKALNWGPGHRLDIDAVDGVLVIGSVATGRHVVGRRGELSLPMAARQMCGIVSGLPVLLAVSVPDGTLVIHPAATVAHLLSEFHARLVGGHDAG
jgi:bifunctional DNA-binding transcriptional regulator/antitoxin component of YhaV-PrlF toxin-antitoxin module